MKPMAIKALRNLFSACAPLGVACLFFLLSSQSSFGQLQVKPLKRSGIVTRENHFGRTKETAPLTLPFFDDFSKPLIIDSTNEWYPHPDLWERGFPVSVNDGLAINAPTLNVATFDGLDSAGNAYNAQEIFLNGFTDNLVSRPIDLSETSPVNPVSISERNTVYLSFYYQWKGNGEAPDADDYLQVQFLNGSGQWETTLTINTSADFVKEKFYPATIKIDGDRFFSKNFKFRIRSFGRQSGPYDTWNLDYFYLNKNRSLNDVSVPDQAISSPLSSIFPNGYRAIPYSHFLAGPRLIAPKFTVSNLRGGSPDVLNYFIEANVTNIFFNEDDTVAVSGTFKNLDPNPAPPNSEGINDDGTGTILPFETRVVTAKYISSIDTINYMDPDASAVKIDLKVNLLTGDNIDPDTGNPADDYDPKYAPIDFRINDTLHSHFELGNYYAYDDGVAEYAGGLVEAGNVFAYRFDLPPTLHDTLRVLEAFDIYFPSFGITSNQNVDFFVFNEENGKPHEILVRVSSVSIRKQENNGFQRIRFLPALQISQNSFFVGWREPVSGELLIGLDNSNNTGDKMFFNAGGGINPDATGWKLNTVITGSFMVRPVFGSGEVDPTTGIAEDSRLDLYPNPNNGSFQISGKAENVSVLSSTGQPVAFETDAFDDRTYVHVNASSGLYIVRYRSMGVTHTQKIIITQ
jgi:hypothetical protein